MPVFALQAPDFPLEIGDRGAGHCGAMDSALQAGPSALTGFDNRVIAGAHLGWQEAGPRDR